MEKKEDLQKFILEKIADVDRMLEKENQDMAKLKLITMRSSYAKVHIFNKEANVKLFEELIRALQKLFLKSQNLSEKWKN